MPDFRVYFIGDDGHIASVREIADMPEAKAIAQARQWLNGHDLEVWQGDRQVAILSKIGDDPSSAYS
jgi:hypothetical protein